LFLVKSIGLIALLATSGLDVTVKQASNAVIVEH
jgi:hypothetical protein